MMMRNWLFLVGLALLLLLSACAGGASPSGVTAEAKVEPLPLARGKLFAGSGNCVNCHTQMKDQAQVDVSTDRLWRATMMANAARDPYWQATVRREALSVPGLQADIEDKCATCHMPMARFSAREDGQQGVIFGQDQAGGFLDIDHTLHPLAIDGVSCSLCHQVQDGYFGEQASFSGGFTIDLTKPMGERDAFGPYPVEKNLAVVMQGASGFTPTQGLHLERAEMCAVCHTLYTPYVDANGQVAGEFPEQMVYFEWVNSSYQGQKSCQACHMPLAQGGVQISITGGPARSPFYQHVFVGGNSYLPQLLQEFGQDLQVSANMTQFETTRANALAQLGGQTARLELNGVSVREGRLEGQIVLISLVGHKFPGGFPSRRAWLHISVRDQAGEVVFESGAPGVDGSIAGNDNDRDPAAFEPHYSILSSPDQAQIYEAILVDDQAKVTTTLLRAAAYGKDNRLLPAGFDLSAAQPEIAVVGEALKDPDFTGGGDSLDFAIDLTGRQGPFTLVVELLYQSVGYRWARNLDGLTNPEIERFRGYIAKSPNLPAMVTQVSLKVE